MATTALILTHRRRLARYRCGTRPTGLACLCIALLASCAHPEEGARHREEVAETRTAVEPAAPPRSLSPSLVSYSTIRLPGSPASRLLGVRFGRHHDYDRAVFDFTGPPPPLTVALWIRSIEEHLRIPDLDGLEEFPTTPFAISVALGPIDSPGLVPLVEPSRTRINNRCINQPQLQVVVECLAAIPEADGRALVLLGLSTPAPWEVHVMGDRLVIDVMHRLS